MITGSHSLEIQSYSVYKASACSSVEYCSPYGLALHLSILDSVAEALKHLVRLKHRVSHHLQVGGLCFLPSILLHSSLCSQPSLSSNSRVHAFFQ